MDENDGFVPCRPFVRYSYDYVGNKKQGHPHIIMGRIGSDYVSVSVTNDMKVNGMETALLPDNIKPDYVVADRVYVRPYWAYGPMYGGKKEYFVSDADERLCSDIVAQAKVRQP